MGDKKSFIARVLPEAAKQLISRFPQKFNYTDIKGYLAESEFLVHKFIMDLIHNEFPGSFVYSEEGIDSVPDKHENKTEVWILDPVCGTANFIKDIPLYVISLSVLDSKGIFCAGIYDMNRDELFLADQFETTLNGQKVITSQVKKLDEAMVSVNCNQSAWMDGELTISNLVNKFMPPITRRVRIFESANLELAYVACGRLDGYINPEDKLWDMAAGSLMIASAGGKTKILQGSISTFKHCKGIIASNQFLMESLVEVINS